MVGAGLWGQALARLVQAAGNEVLLAALGPKPRRKIPCTKDLGEAAEFAELVLLATTPAQLTPALKALGLGPQHRVVVCTQGLHEDQDHWSTTRVSRHTPAIRVGVLAGPAYSTEVLAGKPCAVVVASHYRALCLRTQRALHSSRCRVYTSDDPHGIEFAGVMTRVLAVAVGLSDRMQMGPGGRGLVVSRGLAEALRLGNAMGVDGQGLFGLAGIGDLVATISDPEHPALLAGLMADSEPIQAAIAALSIGRKLGVDLPLTEAVVAVARGQIEPAQALEALMRRELKEGER